jgi:hypothetical protein
MMKKCHLRSCLRKKGKKIICLLKRDKFNFKTFNVLLLNDTFRDYIINSKGSMAKMSAVHPVWNTSAKNYKIDFNNVKMFPDKIIDMIDEAGLKLI